MLSAVNTVLTRSARPTARRPNFDKIPRALRKHKNFVLWRYFASRDRSGSTTWRKVPFQCSGLAASSTDPRTWCSFDQVVDAYQRGGHDGVGYVTAGVGIPKRLRDDFVMIDLDKCRDPTTNTVEPWAAEIINTAMTERAYIELSPSGTGFHIIGRGPQGFAGQKGHSAELYCSERYFTLTGGLCFDPKQRSLGMMKKTIALVKKRIGVKTLPAQDKASIPTSTTVPRRPYAKHITDGAILRLAFAAANGAKLRRLLEGDISDYCQGDEGASRAELACVGILAFWFWLDPVAIERVMRASKLRRQKWETLRRDRGDPKKKITYLQSTIQMALTGRDVYYGQPRPFMAEVG